MPTKKEARQLFRSYGSTTLAVFDLHGLGIFIPEVTVQIIHAAEELHKNLMAEKRKESSENEKIAD